MEHIKNINSKRLQWCCDQAGISQESLARSANVPLSNLHKVMSGTPGFTFLQLRKVANFFGRGVLFFLEAGDVDPEKVLSAQFRTIGNQKSQLSQNVRCLIRLVERHRDLFLGLREEIREPVIIFIAPAGISSKQISRAASEARQWLGLTNENTFQQYRRAIEKKGVLVFRSNGYAGKWQIPQEDPICGFTIYDEQHPAILVRKQTADARQTFTLMHELGHLLLHKSSFIDDSQDLKSHQGKEHEANIFAGLLLVPDDVLNRIDDNNRPQDVTQFDEWLSPFRKGLGISIHVLLLRLLNEGRLSQKLYDSYATWRESIDVPPVAGGSRTYRYREPIHIYGRDYVGSVLQSLTEKKMTLSRACTYLDNLKISDVHKLLKENL